MLWFFHKERGKKGESWRKRKQKMKNWGDQGQEEPPGAGRDGKKQI